MSAAAVPVATKIASGMSTMREVHRWLQLVTPVVATSQCCLAREALAQNQYATTLHEDPVTSPACEGSLGPALSRFGDVAHP
jgi:FPC/CPF motif-containing protein YcgG